MNNREFRETLYRHRFCLELVNFGERGKLGLEIFYELVEGRSAGFSFDIHSG